MPPNKLVSSTKGTDKFKTIVGELPGVDKVSSTHRLDVTAALLLCRHLVVVVLQHLEWAWLLHALTHKLVPFETNAERKVPACPFCVRRCVSS